MNSFFKVRVTTAAILLIFAVMSVACGTAETEPQTDTQVQPQESSFISPAQDAKILLGNPVQIQSQHTAADKIARVELWVQGVNDPGEKLIRADSVEEGTLRQEWVPQYVGQYTLKLRSWDTNEQAIADVVRQVEVVDSEAIGLNSETEELPNVDGQAVSFGGPPAQEASPTPEAESSGNNDVQITVVNSQMAPEPTAIPRYPPPPAMPGVPPGPTQAELNNYGPPVPNAAEYLGPYSTDTNRRIYINELDDVAAPVVAGTTVHRAFRLRNIGTATWGPGYELAFYGGRTMGAGGVAFEAFFPTDPPRRNTLVDNNRLIVPEGKPNQTAVLEVLLTAPTTPGVHQSYWRMRDPHGVYFGPIMGVTMEVVRECEFGVYGAPVIRTFRILGVGNVYDPVDPVQVFNIFGDPVTLEWNIINATNFDIVTEGPTGSISSISTTDPNSRATVNLSTLGRHLITLYADNGSCTVQQDVIVEVVPPEDNLFNLLIILAGTNASAAMQNSAGGSFSDLAADGEILNGQESGLAYSSSVSPGNVQAEWKHYDSEANDFTLIAESYRRGFEACASGFNYNFPYIGRAFCFAGWNDWQSTGAREAVNINTNTAAGAVTVANVEEVLCPASFDPNREEYGIRFTMQASKNGSPATPQYSNSVDVRCSPNRLGPSHGSRPSNEIRDAGTSFNPQN